MAAVKGVGITALDAGTAKPLNNEVGKKRVWTDVYEAAALASGSTIEMAKLPIGSKIVGAKIYIDALGASSTLALGDATSGTRYMGATASVTAGVLTANLVDGIGFESTTVTDILITTGGASITGTIKVVIEYLV